jgi:hypothetical protein
MICTYLLQVIVLLKKTGPTILLALKAHQTQLSLDGPGLHRLDVDSVNYSRNYFAYLYIPASETMLHHTRMLIVDRYHL